MTGPQFHEFLIRGQQRPPADRSATTATLIGRGPIIFVAYNTGALPPQEHIASQEAAHGPAATGSEFRYWDEQRTAVRLSARAPLELIAYVVENERPYTEILTADYIMANPMGGQAAYGDSTQQFDDVTLTRYEFRPSRIVSYYREG